MRNWVKKTVPFAVAASLSLTAIPSVVGAQGPSWAGGDHGPGPKQEQKMKQKGKAKWKLKDVEQHWAESTIQKMSLLGIITGYEDMTFQPNKPVTQAEAVVMTIRLLGLEDEAERKADEELPFRNKASIPVWANGSIALAIEEGLIPESHVFQANKAASRLYVTMLLVNAIGAEFDQDWEEATTAFKDIDDLDENERAYLAFAALTELVNGYEDGTFRPNKPVTRAEMAALIDRVLEGKDFDEIGFDQIRKGTIDDIDVDDYEIIVDQQVKSDGENDIDRITYEVDEDAEIYIDGKERDFEDLEEGMSIQFIYNEDQIISYISAKSEEDQDSATYEGTILKLEDDEIRVKLEDFKPLSLDLSNDVEIELEDGKEGNIDSLQAGQKISFSLNNKGDISFIEILEQAEDVDVVELLDELEDLEKLDIELKGDDSFKAELFLEVNDDSEFEAKVEVKDGKEFEAEGKEALSYLVDLFDELDVEFENKVETKDFLENLIDYYDVDDAEIEGVIIVDGKSYNLEDEQQSEEQADGLLSQIEDLEKLDMVVNGEDFNATVTFDREDDDYEAAVQIQIGESVFNYSKESSLNYLVKFLDDKNIELTKDNLEIAEFKTEFADRYDVKNAEFEGVIIVDGKTYDLKDEESIDEEIQGLLNNLKSLTKVDFEIQGKNDTEASFKFERAVSENEFEAEFNYSDSDSNVTLRNKKALQFFEKLFEDFDENTDAADVKQLIEKIMTEYEIEEAEVEGSITIESTEFDLEDLFQ